MSNSQFVESSPSTTYDWSPSKITRFLLSIISLLIFFNLLETIIVYWLNTQGSGQYIATYFNFDHEANLPSLYSALALAFCSYLLATIATVRKKVKDKYVKYWKALAWIFLYLAIDEACSIHEMLNPVMKGIVNAEGLLYFAWVIPAFFLVIIFLLIFRKFILALPTKTRTLFILSGIVYIAGALGMETIGGYIADTQGYHAAYAIASSIEELLEMFGVVIFVNALLSYLQSHTSQINFSLSFQHSKVK